ncbi:MAG: hypothetical protein EXR72_23970 [Myxococcales bacterium]|nr:hypothetical protein [Myxococcales bacterium]
MALSPCWPDLPADLDVRRRVIERFPLTVVYLVRDDTLIIVAVAHQRRRPGYWMQRLRDG